MERRGVGVDTGTPDLLLMMAPLLASVSKNDTNSSEKLWVEEVGLISRSLTRLS